MKLDVLKGSTNVTLYVFIQDTAGAPLTGLVFDSAGLVCYYARPLAAAAQLALVTQTVNGAHADGGFVEVSSANMPGIYRLDLSDAIVAAGVDSVVIMLKGATGMAALPLELQLTSYDPNNAVTLGLSGIGLLQNGAIVAATFGAGAIDVAAVDPAVYAANADVFLDRDLAGGGSGDSRNVRNALRVLRNRVVVSALGAVTIYEEDDTTPAWTGTATRTGGADPITEIAPA